MTPKLAGRVAMRRACPKCHFAVFSSEHLSNMKLRVECRNCGWSIGFHREGFECQGIDIVDVGYPYDLYLTDISDYSPQFAPDIVVQSPPCTEFSTLTLLSYIKGQRGPPQPEKGIELVKEAIRVRKEAEPKFWILENVYGSLPHLVPLLGKPMLLAKPWVLWGNLPPQLFDSHPNRSGNAKLSHSFEHHGKGGDVMGKGGGRIGLPEDFPFDPLRSWKRARIPVFLAQQVARWCKANIQPQELIQP
jgi:ribosomal protein S27AE